MTIILSKKFILTLIAVLVLGYGAKSFAQTSPSVLYVPLIGITSVPKPLALPKGPGNVTYSYAVKNFLRELPLTDIIVVDDKCNSIKFVTGDDNKDSKLDFSETWRYTCTTKLSETTKSIATAMGTANNITAKQNSYATVVVGSNITPPLISIVNITKVTDPVPAEGESIDYTYKVNNPGVVPLSDVTVTDDKCGTISGKLGDTNGNNLLDINEVWIYTCSIRLTQTTTNTATVTAFANGLRAVADTILTVNVAAPVPTSNLFDVAIGPVAVANNDLKVLIWAILAAILAALIIFWLIKKNNTGKTQTRQSTFETAKPRKK